MEDIMTAELRQLLERIGRATELEIPEIFRAALARYNACFPDWVVSAVSVENKGDRNEQLDNVIRVLQRMKSE